MFKNPRLWIVMAYGACAIGGTIGVWARMDRGHEDALFVVSAMAFLLGFGGFMAFVWALIREGGPPRTESELEKAGKIGVAAAYITMLLFRILFWGLAAAGLANIMGLGQTAYWTVTVFGFVIGLVRGVRLLRNLRRSDQQATDTSGDGNGT